MVHLADVQQRHLISLTDASPTLPIDASLAGWSYRTLSLHVQLPAELLRAVTTPRTIGNVHAMQACAAPSHP